MLTPEEEEILKLIVAEIKAKYKLIEDREKKTALTVPLQEALKTSQDLLKARCL